jgi:hypothetical protein
MSKTKKRDDNALTSLTVKVPDKIRRYWIAKAKMQGTDVSKMVVEHLTKKLGLPPDEE